MKDIALVIMAAGIRNRFGSGIKQLGPVGPGDKIIMDYSVHDTMEAGFNKAIFITRRDLEEDFKEIIGHRVEKLLPVEHVYQELQDLPAGYEVALGRTKPWGTGQAVFPVKGMIDGSFLVINTDDYCGREGFHRIHDYMAEHMDPQSEICDICMGGFMLPNTLSNNDIVTRDVCQVDGDGFLADVIETYNIQMKEDGLHVADKSDAPVAISPPQPISMNIWGLSASFVQEPEKGFLVSLDSLEEGDTKSGYLLPKIIDNLIQNKKARVTVLDTPDKWLGITYREDKQAMADTIRGLIKSGVYEEELFGQGVLQLKI